jgi:hypothetical protein
VVFSANPLTTLVFVVFGYLIGIIEHTDITLVNNDFNLLMAKFNKIIGISVTIIGAKNTLGDCGRDTGTAISSRTPFT